MRRETERIQAELAERELEEARQMLEAAKKKGGAKALKIKDGAPLNKQARTPWRCQSGCTRLCIPCMLSFVELGQCAICLSGREGQCTMP